ncbi:unnamed protein product [Cuscuta campestris]|uniref:Uncharacterized protein n=1 Tax=Cuscuta campestris TaxID=132261 RepID=A0A484K459_9ASTE|nr:unnamed protein product [Cuscuta campestris]
MAKKKPVRPAEENPHDGRLPDDYALEKLEILKNLNGRLIKETAEKRDLVGSLQREKISLESELARAESEKLFVGAELTRVADSAARLELEKTLEAEYLRAQMGERMSSMEEEMEGMRKEKDDVGERAMGFQRSICLLVKEKRVIEEMLAVIEREKQAAVEEKNAEMKKRRELENEFKFLKGKVLNLHEVEVVLRKNATELERMFEESIENGKEMERKISELMMEKTESESKISMLYGENSLIESKLANAFKEIEEKKLTVERFVLENMEMKDANTRAEAEVIKLHNQVIVLMDTISGLEKSSKVQEEEIAEFKAQVAKYKSSSERAFFERDRAQKELDEEKQNGLVMKGKIKELEKRIDEVASELGKTKTDCANILGEKKEIKIQSELLNKEIVSLRAQLDEASADLDKVLEMLRTTAVSVGGSNEEMGRVRARKLKESQINPHVLELEAIKKGLKDREIKVEDMKREVECLKNLVVHANKKKSFLAIVSSATTLFAAISLAYAARFH